MANRLKGITLEIGGDTTSLSKSLSGVNKEIKDTQAQLKDLQKLLKMDPGNIDLLKQKHKLLTDQVKNTKEKLEELKAAQQNMDASGVDQNSAQYMNLQREIIATEQELKNLQTAADQSNVALAKIGDVAQNISTKAQAVADSTKALSGAAAGVLGSLAAAGYSAVTTADDLNTLSKQSGFTTAELQKMEYASDRIDVSMDTITGAAQKLKKNMASGASAFNTLGVSITNADGSMRNVTDVFWDTVSALSEVSNETERDQIAMDLFGKSADSLAGIIDDGGQAFRELGDEAERAGLIMSQETLDSLNAVNDEIDKVKATAKATLAETGAKAVEAMLPVLNQIIDAIGRLLTFLGSLDESQLKIIITVLSVIAAISPVASAIAKISGAVATLTPLISQAVTWVSGAASAVGTLLMPAISGIGTALTALWGVIMANPVVAIIAVIVAAIVLLWNTNEDFRNGVIDAWNQIRDAVVNFGQEVWDFISGLAESIAEAFSALWEKIQSIWSTLTDYLTTTWENVKERVKEGAEAIHDGIKEGFEKAKEAAQNALESLLNICKDIANSLISVVENAVNHVINSLNSVISAANSAISAIASVVGISFSGISTIPTVNLPRLAKGGSFSSGSAIVGEAGPELLTVAAGSATVQPLTNSQRNGGAAGALGAERIKTDVNVSFSGSLAQLGAVLQPVITAETTRLGPSLLGR